MLSREDPLQDRYQARKSVEDRSKAEDQNQLLVKISFIKKVWRNISYRSRQDGSSIQVSECGGWSRISQVISRNINGLD